MTTANVLIGPVIKSTDGYSPLQGMTSSLIDINFWKTATNGALTSWDYDGDNSFATYGNGYINLGLRSSNVCIPGQLRIEINASASGIPTFDDFQVINQHVYDALYCSSGIERLQTDAWEITGTGITSASVMMGVNVVQMASAAVSTVTAQIAVNVVQYGSAAATGMPITTGTVYDIMDHGMLMTYLQSYVIGDFGVTGPSTNQVIYKNYAGSTYMMHTFTTKTRVWSS
jgi:hypothetical protein